MTEKIFCVYMHKNKITGKVYIGATSNKPETRWANGLGYKGNKKFYADILQYGWNNFEHTIIIEKLNQEQSQVLEKYYIQKYRDNCYNKSVGGEPRVIKPKKFLTKIKEEKNYKNQAEYNKIYYQKHKEEIKQRTIERQKLKRQEYNEYKRDYYRLNEEYHQKKIQYQRNYRTKKKLEVANNKES